MLIFLILSTLWILWILTILRINRNLLNNILPLTSPLIANSFLQSFANNFSNGPISIISNLRLSLFFELLCQNFEIVFNLFLIHSKFLWHQFSYKLNIWFILRVYHRLQMLQILIYLWFCVCFIDVNLWEFGMNIPIIFIFPMKKIEFLLLLASCFFDHFVSPQILGLENHICWDCPLSEFLERLDCAMNF